MKYVIYHEGGDEEVFVEGKDKGERNVFVFTGLGNGIHPYYQKQWKWLLRMLSSAGVILNIKNVSTVNEIGKNADSGVFEMEDLWLPKDAKPSFDGKIYILIQDTEMGRGWAVLLWVRQGSGNILAQDHRDNVLCTLMEGDWVRSFGIDFQRKEVKNLSKIK